jgi:hypothetical protein
VSETGGSSALGDPRLEDLTGTWDLVVTGNGIATDTVEISEDVLRVTTSQRELVLIRTSEGWDGTYLPGRERLLGDDQHDLFAR